MNFLLPLIKVAFFCYNKFWRTMMDIEKLEKLNELKEKGILSEDEFNKMKQEIISGNKQ